MDWDVNFTYEGKEDLEKLSGEVRERVFNKIVWLKNNFGQIVSLPLSNEWRGFFKLRVGDWRVIYDIDNKLKEITIHRIDKRDKVYKRK
ncbi:MAG: hypothetical protein A2V72_02095 [Candidatus Nealsonbacteria bacterium RBG_13_37_56]|uniref:Addiction module toxin RelE n=1 Tax=Candidatus Nealsonbacteria bacterium RBG_13_37_56 TaxID=1801661 RepID=A0A1G2DZC4_9BACT|nr:MAG: hypothetical protein A2V72_02095 [Candidatus Nealsonbacteria bacterium RBG_13_37_56]